MAVFDKNLHDRFCLTLAEAGFFYSYDYFTKLWGSHTNLETSRTLSMLTLIEAVKSHTMNFRLFKRHKVVQFNLGCINNWDWLGVIVIKRDGVLETMCEGDNGTASVGSTIVACWNQALRSAPESAPSSGPPYLRPWFDGNEQRLSAIVGDLLVQFDLMKNIIQTDMSDLPPR